MKSQLVILLQLESVINAKHRLLGIGRLTKTFILQSSGNVHHAVRQICDELETRGLYNPRMKAAKHRLNELGIDFVDIDDINAEGLLYDKNDRLKVLEKFNAEKIDGLFFPHCNFGTEYVCARLARDMNLPVLLWGSLDERSNENGVRLRDTQCGLFATGKVLCRFRVPFTYMTNCRLNDPAFERGLRDFIAVCNVVKTFRSIRILQIGSRPFDFWLTMCNEGELLEKFNVQLSPIPLPELTKEVRLAKEEGTEVKKTIDYIRENFNSDNYDHFVMNKGHSVEVLYAILADRGFIPEGGLENFCNVRLKIYRAPDKQS